MIFLAIFTLGCQDIDAQKTFETTTNEASETTTQTTKTDKVNVIKVSVSGEESAYNFSVTLESDETGCGQYADWWEVINSKSELLYRRILAHSHPDTQPFTRSGGHVKVAQNKMLYVRGHMNKAGYVGDVYYGSVSKGFKKVTNHPTFPKKLESQSPLPSGCLF